MQGKENEKPFAKSIKGGLFKYLMMHPVRIYIGLSVSYSNQ